MMLRLIPHLNLLRNTTLRWGLHPKCRNRRAVSQYKLGTGHSVGRASFEQFCLQDEVFSSHFEFVVWQFSSLFGPSNNSLWYAWQVKDSLELCYSFEIHKTCRGLGPVFRSSHSRQRAASSRRSSTYLRIAFRLHFSWGELGCWADRSPMDSSCHRVNNIIEHHYWQSIGKAIRSLSSTNFRIVRENIIRIARGNIPAAPIVGRIDVWGPLKAGLSIKLKINARVAAAQHFPRKL